MDGLACAPEVSGHTSCQVTDQFMASLRSHNYSDLDLEIRFGPKNVSVVLYFSDMFGSCQLNRCQMLISRDSEHNSSADIKLGFMIFAKYKIIFNLAKQNIGIVHYSRVQGQALDENNPVQMMS